VNHANALRYLRMARDRTAKVSFVSPIVSTMIAASHLQQTPGSYEFVGDAQGYAEHIGLLAAMEGRRRASARPGGLAGVTYSPLAQLRRHLDVEAATDTVTECLYGGLVDADRTTINEVSRVIGELHDNVASHAAGAGYSALQVYRNPQRLEFAVVDAGVGLLQNVQRVRGGVTRPEDPREAEREQSPG
jgi:hypothetical protein